MSQVDNRNSSAVKRARTDGGRREDDWTCPTCGNVNFSFRTTCNMRNCTQPRPADHSLKYAAKPMQTPRGYSSSAPYVGPGAPSSMYMGFHYNYNTRLPGGSPFQSPHRLSGPAPYSNGSVMGGGMYGVPPHINRYGLAMPIGHPQMYLSDMRTETSVQGPRAGFYPEDKHPKKTADGARDNDWKCPKCGNVNFSFREVCNMRKCDTPKPGSQVAKSGKNPRPEMPEGSWKCEKCNNINYPFRIKCNRQNCGADKPVESKKSPSEPAGGNDQ